MNKILKVLALGAMALSTTACSDFLEVNPRTQVSETEFYKTEDDMMKGLYAVMNADPYAGGLVLLFFAGR